MKLQGKISSGVLRGAPLIGKYFHRLVGLLRFEPFRGTMNVQFGKPIDIEMYSTKTIDHILMDGTKHVDAFLAPIIFSAKGQDYECWAMRHTGHTHEPDTVEIIAKENLKEKFSLNDGDSVEITFFEQERKKKLPGIGILRKLFGRQPQLMKR
jgi:CTP-dependent riboflavin kinase